MINPRPRPRRYIKTIRRRIKFLDKRIRDHLEDNEPADYDKAERAALSWAVEVLERLYAKKIAQEGVESNGQGTV